MPNRKTDVNNNRGFSTDFIGQNYKYPEASYQQREAIVARHLAYQKRANVDIGQSSSCAQECSR